MLGSIRRSDSDTARVVSKNNDDEQLGSSRRLDSDKVRVVSKNKCQRSLQRIHHVTLALLTMVMKVWAMTTTWTKFGAADEALMVARSLGLPSF